jgi:hypothetical protein
MRTALRDDAFSEGFFVSEQGHALTQKALGSGLAQLGRQLGLESTAGGRRPRLPALRQACAIERLRRWHQDGIDGQALLPTSRCISATSGPKKAIGSGPPPLHA